MSDTNQPGTVADAQSGNWVDRHAPDWLKPYARLARWDRPIGFWLLFWPCAWGVALAAIAYPELGFDWWGAILMLAGAILMRGAGCTFNDIVDRDIDMKVARTRSRPIPSGAVTARDALAFLVAQALLASVVLFQFNRFTVWAGVASLVLVAIYPFMKRVTWWPQIFLGLAFSWGALMGWAGARGALELPALLLYAGSIAWVIHYDTIYAHQDREDDALVGLKSTALLFAENTRPALAAFSTAAVVLIGLAGYFAGAGALFALGLAAFAAHLAWQIARIDIGDPESCLKMFRANRDAGLILFAALLLDAAARRMF
jgi:4-hydroxybenzoate polyprenyltransferase